MKVLVELQLLDNWQDPRRARFYHGPREELYWCMRDKGVLYNTKYVGLVRDM